MGNYGRLRRLWLRGEVADARKVWPTFDPDRLGFAPWRQWGRDRMLTRGDELVAAATSDEADPAKVEYDPKVPPHWRASAQLNKAVRAPPTWKKPVGEGANR